MKWNLLLVMWVSFGLARGQASFTAWEKMETLTPLQLEKLKAAEAYLQTLATGEVMVVHRGKVLWQYGEVSRKENLRSIRKSLLSLLYGRFIESGELKRNATLASMGIQDEPPLSPVESQATLKDLLTARSGIYHDALYESEGMRKLKPKRGSHAPGEFWYYNNWDFNALGTIYEKAAKRSIFKAFEDEIARPIGMEDYRASDGSYVRGKGSIHAAYPIQMSARDLARVGQLVLQQGRWGDKQIVSSSWIEESTRFHSDAQLYEADGYGYMWWVAKSGLKHPHLREVELADGAFSARGVGGNYLLVIPQKDLVIVHRPNLTSEKPKTTGARFGRFLKMILEAVPEG